jgi:hypothetical protein
MRLNCIFDHIGDCGDARFGNVVRQTRRVRAIRPAPMIPTFTLRDVTIRKPPCFPLQFQLEYGIGKLMIGHRRDDK